MRRALIRALGAALLFGAGAMSGIRLTSETAPSRLREAVAVRLSETLGTDVSVGSARLLVFPGIRVEATDVSAWSAPSGPALATARLEATIDLAALLSGRLRFSALSVDGVRLALVRRADGQWRPPLLTPGFENPLILLGRLFAADLPASAIEVRSGSLSITDLGAPRTAGSRVPFELSDLTLRLLAPGLFESGRLRLSGNLRGTKAERSPFEFDAISPRQGPPALELAVAGLPLDRLLPYLRATLPGLALDGRASGVLALARAEDGASELTFDLTAEALRGATHGSEGKQPPIAIEKLGAVGTLRIADDSLRLANGELRADDLALTLSGSLSLPATEDARLAFEARSPTLSVKRLRELSAWLPAAPRQAFEEGTRPLASGRFDDLTLAGDAPLDAWRAVLRRGGPWLPAGARLEARVADVVVQPPGDEAVTAIRGSGRLDGPDLLTVAGLEGRLGDRALPILDLRLAGLQHLLAAPPVAVPAVPALPGYEALRDLLRGSPDAGSGAGWTSLDVDADWLLHPAFFRPLRNLKVHLESTPEGVGLRVAQGSWGGIPVRGEGTYAIGTPEHVRLSLEAGSPEEASAPAAPASNWSHGRFLFSAPPREGFHVSSLRGGFDFAGPRLTVFDAAATLGMPGRLTGDARLDLSRPGEVPTALRIALDDARVAEFLTALSDEPAHSSGTLAIDARLEGALRPGAPPLTTLEGDGRLSARDGELAVELPLLLAIAKASTTFNPFGSARGIRFDRIDAELGLEAGRLFTRQGISIESPDLRLVLSGSVQLRGPQHALEAVVGCFFFKPLDQLLGVMPVVSRILLGPDKSLFGTFFELTGSWEAPQAGLLPAKTIALGPATFLMQDVPAFVRHGLEAIKDLLPGLGARAPSVASPAEAAAPVGDGS